jgi:hypothetical protein
MLHAPISENKTQDKQSKTISESESQNRALGWAGYSALGLGSEKLSQQGKDRAQGWRSISLSPLSQGGILQRKCTCGDSGTCSEYQQKEKMLIQRKAKEGNGRNEVPHIVHEVLSSPGQSLDKDIRTLMESGFGHDFGQVRVHTDGKAADSATEVNALAYTVGRDMVFGQGKYAPRTTEGKRLLAHELTHTIQQQQSESGIQSSLQFAHNNIQQEQEADNVANSIVQGQPTSISLFQSLRLARQTDMDGGVDGEINNTTLSPATLFSETDRPVYLCTKPILGSSLHRQGHAFFRVGSSLPGHPTYELEHARSCYCGWQGWPRQNVPEDRDADVPCVLTTIRESCLVNNWRSYPVGKYCARGPNSNTYIREIGTRCGSTTRPPGNVAGYDEVIPTSGSAGAPHPYLSVIGCFEVDCDDTECGVIPFINQDIKPGEDPEA